MSLHTDIEKLSITEDVNKEVIISDDNLGVHIMDFSLDESVRITCIDKYYKIYGADNTVETVNKLAMLYQLSNSKVLRNYLYAICMKSCINSFLKSIAAKALCTQDERDDYGYKAIEKVYPEMDKSIPTPYKIEFVKLLMRNSQYKDSANKYFCEIIDDTTLDSKYRYMCIANLESDKSYFIERACIKFVKNEKNDIRMRILACQNLLFNFKPEINIEEYLYSFAINTAIEYNCRADAADVLLQAGSERYKNQAKDVIMDLASNCGTVKITNIYENAQNVHSQQVEESVKTAIEFLQTFNIMKARGRQIDLEYIKNIILKNMDNKEDIEKIKISLNRISLDRGLYSSYNCSLENILLRVWSYLTGHKDSADIQRRLIEELIEMSGTCSSGFITRLVNTISGFGDFSMRISWRDQIIANLSGRLNALIRDLDDTKKQETILYQMTLETEDPTARKEFLKFLRKNISNLRTELYEEFRNHITDTDFDLYFRSAVSNYETGSFN